MTCDTKEEKIADVELKINGKNVETNCFVQNFIAETLMGMVKCLRGVENVQTIELKIEKK